MKFDQLVEAVTEDAAIRRRQRLQPVGGAGDKIFPPTYPGERQNEPPRHVYERRRIGDEEAWCVLVDSVQSQSNRLEECLLDAVRDGLGIPHVVVDFSAAGLDGIQSITSLEAPHRIYDAILRDSDLNGTPFMSSPIGLKLARARPEEASAVLEVSPTALLFGSWHSTGQGGSVGAKFARCLTSEIVAVNVPVEVAADGDDRGVRTSGKRTGSRIDPLGVLRAVEVYKGENGWDTTAGGAGKKAKKVRPSEINHGNIAPSVQSLGITCSYVEQSFVVSFAALRRLRFGSEEKNAAGRTLLAALGMVALTEQDARGYALRSRCDLVCEGRAPLELVHSDGSSASIDIGRDEARKLWSEAVDRAREAGFDFSEVPLRLVPQPKLVEIVRKSQELTLAGVSDDGDVDGN